MKIIFSIVVLISLCISCSHKNTEEETLKYASQLIQDDFSLSGTYHWNFQLMGGTQSSVHTLYPDSIGYSMEGRVYSTEYTMERLSYEQSIHKWIGQDKAGIVYVLFFEDATDSSLTIYKHKCSSGGLEEALAFERPGLDATEDHGWNVYSRTVVDREDELPVEGTFSHADSQLILADTTVVMDNREFDKLSYHAGERRWVGQSDSTYLQLFFEDFSRGNTVRVSATQFTNLELAYRTKYQSVQFTTYQRQ
ncbi:MAG: hypothetical protein AAGA10_29065 [Bacteroidota bacterium]